VNNIIESSKPDIVIGTETWLKPNIHSVFCIVSLVIIGIVYYAHVQFTLGNFNTLVLLIGGH